MLLLREHQIVAGASDVFGATELFSSVHKEAKTGVEKRQKRVAEPVLSLGELGGLS